MNKVRYFVNQFRSAIELAKEFGEFKKDISFNSFPRGCCGDTSDLLAHYLLENGIKTYYVCGTYRADKFEDTQSHAWLIMLDGTIIDITGDQFKDDSRFLKYDKSVYIGEMDSFHTLFEVEPRDVRESVRLESLGAMSQARMKGLYKTIIEYIENN